MTQVDERYEAEVVSAQSLGMRAANGDEMYAFALRVVVDGRTQHEVQVGSSVPLSALSLLRPGTTLPVLHRPDSDYTELVLDWETAIADGSNVPERTRFADEARQPGAARRQRKER